MAKIKKVHLLRIGFPNGKACQAALKALGHDAYRYLSREDKLALLEQVLDNPQRYYDHPQLEATARAIQPEKGVDASWETPVLREKALPIRIFGEEHIEPGAVNQIYVAGKLPVARAAALMPDAHQGYGLPIGGVLATENAVIPYAVGVDIGCRMCLSMFEIPVSRIQQDHRQLKQLLMEHTTFGTGKGPEKPMDDPVLEREEFATISTVKNLKDKAWKQIGSSGSGNHFVEFGEVQLTDPDNEWDLPTGQYLGLLSHSGSRGLGAGIAQHYTRLAKSRTRLPGEAAHLAWLSMDSEEGQEYWLAMNLAGDYASACHHHIHHRISRALGEKPAAVVENHHNFAWKEQLSTGEAVIVHRKGATPAGKGVLGIIPGSMTAPGFIVRGKGISEAINSASHGAGRVMSRSKAKRSITGHDLRKHLRDHKVTLIGGDLDEAPMAYKDISKVMASQQSLVDVLGRFQPKIVRMA